MGWMIERIVRLWCGVVWRSCMSYSSLGCQWLEAFDVVSRFVCQGNFSW